MGFEVEGLHNDLQQVVMPGEGKEISYTRKGISIQQGIDNRARIPFGLGAVWMYLLREFLESSQREFLERSSPSKIMLKRYLSQTWSVAQALSHKILCICTESKEILEIIRITFSIVSTQNRRAKGEGYNLEGSLGWSIPGESVLLISTAFAMVQASDKPTRAKKFFKRVSKHLSSESLKEVGTLNRNRGYPPTARRIEKLR